MRLPVTVGLDLSLQAAAVALVRGPHDGRIDRAEVWQKTAVFKEGKSLRGLERLEYLRDSIFLFVRESLGALEAFAGGVQGVDLWVIEGYGFDTHNAHSLGELGGVVKLQLWDIDARIAIPTPATIKSFVLGRGVGEKSLMMKEAFKRWGFDVDCEGQADAFCQAMFGQMVLSGRMTAAQARLVDKKVEFVEPRSHGGSQGKAALPPADPSGPLAGRVRRRRAS